LLYYGNDGYPQHRQQQRQITGFYPYTIGGIPYEKEIVEQLGSELEKKEKDNKMDSKAPDYYYRIVEEARKRHECSWSHRR
jgi:hypothetical protein